MSDTTDAGFSILRLIEDQIRLADTKAQLTLAALAAALAAFTGVVLNLLQALQPPNGATGATGATTTTANGFTAFVNTLAHGLQVNPSLTLGHDPGQVGQMVLLYLIVLLSGTLAVLALGFGFALRAVRPRDWHHSERAGSVMYFRSIPSLGGPTQVQAHLEVPATILSDLSRAIDDAAWIAHRKYQNIGLSIIMLTILVGLWLSSLSAVLAVLVSAQAVSAGASAVLLVVSAIVLLVTIGFAAVGVRRDVPASARALEPQETVEVTRANKEMVTFRFARTRRTIRNLWGLSVSDAKGAHAGELYLLVLSDPIAPSAGNPTPD